VHADHRPYLAAAIVLNHTNGPDSFSDQEVLFIAFPIPDFEPHPAFAAFAELLDDLSIE
jgi:hypothetical protein